MNIDAITQQFAASSVHDRNDLLDSLITKFKPADYRHAQRALWPELFVGDMIALLPSEIIHTILSYLPIHYVYKLRQVSTAWNAFFSDPAFETVQKGSDWFNHASFLQKAKARAALLNGVAFSRRYYTVPRATTDDDIDTQTPWFYRGVAVVTTSRAIQVYDFYQSTRIELVGDDLERFRASTIGERVICATTQGLTCYVWTLDGLRIDKFRTPEILRRPHVCNNIIRFTSANTSRGYKYIISQRCFTTDESPGMSSVDWPLSYAVTRYDTAKIEVTTTRCDTGTTKRHVLKVPGEKYDLNPAQVWSSYGRQCKDNNVFDHMSGPNIITTWMIYATKERFEFLYRFPRNQASRCYDSELHVPLLGVMFENAGDEFAQRRVEGLNMGPSRPLKILRDEERGDLDTRIIAWDWAVTDELIVGLNWEQRTFQVIRFFPKHDE